MKPNTLKLSNSKTLPLLLPGGTEITDPTRFAGSTIGNLISEALKYTLPFAGLILFGILIWGGFELLTSQGNPEATKKAQDKITSAVIGFVIIFIAYWIVQALQVIFGLETIF